MSLSGINCSTKSDSKYEINDQQNNNEEPTQDYCKGGYCPINYGDMLKQKYLAIRKLGWGERSTVWLFWDFQLDKFFAIKIFKSSTKCPLEEKRFFGHFQKNDSIKNSRERILIMKDNFRVPSVNGSHVCIVHEVLKETLSSMLKRTNSKGIPIQNVKKIVKQLLEGIDYLHNKCNIVHTSLNLDNIYITGDKIYIKNLAKEALNYHMFSLPIPGSFVSTAPIEVPQEAPEGQVKKKKKNTKKKLRKVEKPIHSNMDKLKILYKKLNQEQELGDSKTRQEKNCNISSGDNSGQAEPSLDHSNQSVCKFPSDEIFCEMIENLHVSNNEASGSKGKKRSENPSDDKNPKERKKILLDNERKDPAFEEVDVKIKIGNLKHACFVNKHSTENIQVQQYRCLEVILSATYGTPADIWNIACIAFELATGKQLFIPDFFTFDDSVSVNERHLSQIISVLGEIPNDVKFSGKHSPDFFNEKGELRHVKNVKKSGIVEILTKQHKWSAAEASAFSEFLMPMLALDPADRASAWKCLKHPWLAT